MPSPSTTSLVFFGLVLCFAAGFPIYLYQRVGGRLSKSLVALALWLLATGSAVWLVTPDNPFPSAPLFMVGMTVVITTTALGPVGKAMMNNPLSLLVGYQGFRIPLELVMAVWVKEDFLCDQMTWTGSNPDILAGVLGLVGGWVASSRPKLAYGLNLIALGLLFNVVRVALTSIPNTPVTRFDDPLWLPFQFPTIYIASVAVMGALFIHLVTLRKMLGR